MRAVRMFRGVRISELGDVLTERKRAFSNRMPTLPIGAVVVFVKQRLTALFFVGLIIFGASSQTMIAFADASSNSGASNSADSVSSAQGDHKTSTAPSVGTINTASPPAPAAVQPSKYAAAADASPLSSNSGSSTSFLDKVAGTVNDQPVAPLPDPSSKPSITPHELTDQRTATSSKYLNKDGSVTETNYFAPHYYQTSGSWQPINNTLVEDDNAADSGNIFGQAFGKIESLVSNPNAYQTQANSWDARFTPSDFSGGMVRVKQGSDQVGFNPVNANAVNPVVTTDSQGNQTVTYSNLWNGVDVTYRVESDKVKESILIKNKGAASKVQFTMVGASLQKPSTTSKSGNVQPAFMIHGALGDKFGIESANLLLNHFGYTADQTSGLSQTTDGSTLTIGVNSSYLQKLPGNAFPVTIDPTITSSFTTSFGTTGTGSYLSFESNGTICDPTTCDPYAGGFYDNTSTWQDWRTALYAPYGGLLGTSTLTNADLHLVGTNTVASGTYTYQFGKATCQTGYSCMDTTWDSASMTNATQDVNVTNIYNSYMSAGNQSGWVMIDGADGTGTTSAADFNPNESYVTFTYTSTLPAPTFITPQSGQVFTDPQPSFNLQTESNPNNSTVLGYSYEIWDSADSTGAVTNSGLLNGTAWTVPDGILQNGRTYYVEASSYDSSTTQQSPWTAPVPFTINLREGTDQSQTYDTVGPAKVDLVTGNLQTGTASHTTTALGGNMGVGLNYSSPIKSRPGLAASYWNVASGYSGGTPTTAPNLTRVDQNINFNWNSGSPGSGVNSTWFYTLWSGYFVAPTSGTYYFGGIHDDSLTLTVNGTQVYTGSNCYTGSGPCYGSSIALTAGQVVSFKAQYEQGTSSDYAQVYVKGPVAERIIPEAWFQTGVRQLPQYGLVGKYYTYNDAGTPPSFPSNGTDGLFMTRTDTMMSFYWYGGVPIANGPKIDWMVRWTGYLTVPATGSYTFGTQSEDGSKVIVNGTTLLSRWTDSSSSTPSYGTAVSLTAGQRVPIEVDYYHHTAPIDQMSLLVEPLGGASEVTPASWLTPSTPVLPNGWTMGLGSGVTYTHLTADTTDVVLSDDSGNTYDYAWNGTGYTPPANSHGFLLRNEDGTFTLQDSDGKTYVFDVSGNLASVTSATDDAHQASLQYSFGAVGSGGPTSLQQITDATNSNRNMKIYYSGASQCGSAPSGFYTAPTNMLCAAQTNDGRTTYFYYDSNGNLAEVLQPGNAATQYQYQSVLNPDSSVMGYQLAGIRDSLANDAVTAGTRSNDATTFTSVSYDALGRVTSVAEPAATSGASQLTKTIAYAQSAYWQPATTDTGDTIASGASPTVVSMGPGRLDMFARGTSSNLIHKYWTGMSWSSWENLGGCIINDPSATSWGAGRLDVVAEGCNSTGVNLDHIWWTSGSGWGSWEAVGASRITSSPVATTWGTSSLNIFANGSTGSNLYHEWYDGGGWGSGENLGGCITGTPTASTWGVPNLEIFAQHCSGSGNNLDHMHFISGVGWSSWGTDAVHIGGQIAAASSIPGQVDLVATTSTNTIQTATYTESSNSWTGWTTLALCSTVQPSLSPRLGVGSFVQYDLFAQPCSGGSSDVFWQQYMQPLNTTIEHITGATEPVGYSEKVVYDNHYRTTQVYNNLGEATTNEWDPAQDLLYSQTNPEGLMTTTAYDDEGRPVSQYGPAPASNFNRWNYTLVNGQGLTEGQSLTSPNGRFQFSFQTDGNLTVKDNGTIIWGTGGGTATNVIMQSDGNLVKYNGTTVIGQTNTAGAGPSTYLVMQNDGNAVMYNSAGPVWSTNTGGATQSPTPSSYGTPLTAYASQVSRTDVSYDQSMTGLADAYTAVNEPVANRASLSGAPLKHSTNIASDGTITHDWSTTAPVTTTSGNWGMSMTGVMRLSSTGNWTISPTQDGGIRMWIDGQLVIDNWRDNTTANTTKTESYTFNNTVANSAHSVRIDYYHLVATGDATFSLAMTPPGGSSTTSVASYFSPNYGLKTSATSYDATIGNTTVTTSYGSSPELGQATSATVDPTGLNLTTSATYGTSGAGTDRVTSQTSAGGSTTSYTYYAASDTATNPCVSGSSAAYQAGMLKTTTSPSPDGGTTPGKTVTVVYDDAGNIVATETNSDGWECNTYDSRGRLTQDVVPAFNGSSSRTTTYNYNVSGNPLVTSVTDGSGTITTTSDLLGRTVSYTDASSDTTTTSYDSLGRVSSQASPIGTESYTYDNYNRVTDVILGSDHLAQPSYDQYGRLSTVTYSTGGTLKTTANYDTNTGAENSVTYNLSDGSSITDAVTRTQSGKASQDVLSSGSSSLTSNYTYDKAGRLTAATIGSNTYGYGYGTQNSSCGSASNMNANSGKNGNLTSQTINGTTNTYCYNYADQLLSSSDTNATSAVYDSHGNMTQIGSTSGSPLRLTYDSSDRVTGMKQYNASNNGTGTSYSLDAAGRLTYREQDTITSGVSSFNSKQWYGYTGGSGTSFAMNSSSTVTEEYISLPGGVTVTIKPSAGTKATKYAYNLPNLHSNTTLTADGNGNNSSSGSGPNSAYVYDPYGNALTSAPANYDQGSEGYAGAAQKITETTMAAAPILMGARVYLASIARFTSQDPIPGGNANAYSYALDPINFNDFSGMYANITISWGGSGGIQGGNIGTRQLQPTVTVTQVVYSVAKTSHITSAPRAQAPAVQTATKLAAAPVNAISEPVAPVIVNFTPESSLSGAGTPPVGVPFSFTNGASSALDYAKIGSIVGSSGGCILGEAIDIAGGCIFVGGIGLLVLTPSFAVWGFLEGGAQGADKFDTGGPDVPDYTDMFK